MHNPKKLEIFLRKIVILYNIYCQLIGFVFGRKVWQNMDMQYKIPIQVENEDTIILGLSLRQMGIIIVGLILAFGLFNKFD